MQNSQIVLYVALPILAAALVTTPAAAGKDPEHPSCLQISRGLYVEGSLPLTSFAGPNEAPEAPKQCWPSRSDKNGQLIFPPSVMLSVSDPDHLVVYVRLRGPSGKDEWRQWKLPYDRISCLAFGFIPKQPGLAAAQAAIIGTSVAGATTVLGTSNILNRTWKASLGIAGIGIAVTMGGYALYRHHWPKPETYYLTIRYSDSPITGAELDLLVTNELKYPQYVPKGDVAVFAMGMNDFWGVTHVLQSKTGLPLQPVATPGQASAKSAE